MKMFLFDIDGTLISTGGAGDRSLTKAFLRCYGIPAAMDNIKPSGKTDPAIIREIFHQKLGRDCSPAELDHVRDNYLDILQSEVQTSHGYHLKCGIADILETIYRADSCLLGLVTGNYEQGARIKLGRADINRYFRFGGFGSDSESRPQLTRIGIERGHMLQRHLSHNREIYLVGDTPYDIDAGKKAGVVTVAVATGPWKANDLASHNPDFLFEDFSNPEGFFHAAGLEIR